MPLSEHEQRMLDQIESALYAEDPKFASSVRGGRLGATSGRRRLQGAALFCIGLAMLVIGVAVPATQVGNFPVLSVTGFVVMFGAAVFAIIGSRRSEANPAGQGRAAPPAVSARIARPAPSRSAWKSDSAAASTTDQHPLSHSTSQTRAISAGLLLFVLLSEAGDRAAPCHGTSMRKRGGPARPNRYQLV